MVELAVGVTASTSTDETMSFVSMERGITTGMMGATVSGNSVICIPLLTKVRIFAHFVIYNSEKKIAEYSLSAWWHILIKTPTHSQKWSVRPCKRSAVL